MPLTALQRTVLESYRTFLESPLTIWRMIVHSSKYNAILFIFFSLMSIISYLEVSESAGFLVAGMGAGAILRDLAHYRQRVRIWPVVKQVLDWQKIDDLLAGREEDDSKDGIAGQQ